METATLTSVQEQVEAPQEAEKRNCWEIKKCGREPGGAKVAELGVCPATVEIDFNGFLGGKNSGRACWLVAGTFCKGQVQGTFAQKFKNCSQCEFYKQVMEEEGELFKPADMVMKYIDKTHEQRVDERTHELREAKEAVEATQIKLERAYKELKEVNHIASLDMDIAARIQSSYFPQAIPRSPDWDVSFIFKPVSKVSGDFYDFYSQNGALRGVSLFDVSGHGIGAGLLTLLARSIIAEHISQNDTLRLSAIVEQANRRLINEIGATSNYLTGVILRFTDNKVEYVNAGHTDIFIRRKAGTVGEVKPAAGLFHGPVLGLKSVQKRYRSLLFSMEAGDMLLLYTDCFTEARNAADEPYGSKRIAKSFSSLDPREDTKKLIRRLEEDFYSFVDKSRIRDDLTVVLVKRKERS